jgi:type II secretory pathway pseudopilin PulG
MNNLGLTLIEMIVSAVLFSSIAGVLLMTFVSSNKMGQSSEERSFGTHLIREQLEILYGAVRQSFFAADDNGDPLDPGTNQNITLFTEANDGVNGTRSYDVQSVTGKDYRKVTVTLQTN